MIEGLKPFYNAVLSPIANLLIRFKVHPNVVTITGVFVSGIAGYFIVKGQWTVAAVTILFASCMDGLDGQIARITNTQSRFGAVLDSVCDRITEMIWLFGVLVFFVNNTVIGHVGIYLAFCALNASLLVSYVRARCEGEDIACSSGLLQRPERIILFVICLMCGAKIMIAGLTLLTILAVVTVVQRIAIAFRTKR
jgi:CDP-diacylglycerol--glycerol-3-phosphate 3-phosphatidyltransferase